MANLSPRMARNIMSTARMGRIVCKMARRCHSASVSNIVNMSSHSTLSNTTIVAMNDNKTRNSLNEPMVSELTRCINEASSRKDCKLLILTSDESHKVFCAGHNIKEMNNALTETNETKWKHIFELCSNLLTCIRSCNIPIICAAHGIITAAGIQIASACDIIVCTKDSKFSIPGLSIGVNASRPAFEMVNENICSAGINENYTNLGMEMLLSGKSLTAQEAYDRNMINDIADNYHDMINQVIPRKYGSIVEKSSLCQCIGKQTFYQQRDQVNVEKAYNIAQQAMVKNMKFDDAKEGIQSFLEKRQPHWQNR